MSPVQLTNMISYFVLAILAISSSIFAEDEPVASAPSTNSSEANNVFSGDWEPEPKYPDDEEMEKGIEEYRVQICLLLVGECWLNFKRLKPYIPEERRLQLCFKNTKGYYVCHHLTEADAQKGKEEAEQREQAKENTEAEAAKEEEERKQKLVKRIDALNGRTAKVKEDDDQGSSTTKRTSEESDEDENGTVPGEFAEAEKDVAKAEKGAGEDKEEDDWDKQS